MTEARICPHCGKPVIHTGLGGVCPECMLKVGAPTQDPVDAAGPNGTKIVEPAGCLTPAQIAQDFPQIEILECLGRGGMGVVYRARQPKLNRLVALKLLAPERGGDPRFAERFEREAQALARLNHPNIVTVYDFGVAGAHYYLLMEFVDGTSLRQLLKAGSLAPEQALAIVPRICEALQFAHDKGVVHRDIKPENVLLDKEGRVKIADFGIAKIIARGGGQRALTQDEQVIGTPHYMAPEQVEHPQRVDHRADIYSLGVVFYEMLTGELPLGKFAPPSRKVQVDVRLDEVVLHALEKEPDRRYQRASEVKTDVENIAGSPTSSHHAASPGLGQDQTPPPPPNPAPMEKRPPSEIQGQQLLFRSLFFLFIGFFWTGIGLKKGLPWVVALGLMITAAGSIGLLWGASRMQGIEWWRKRRKGLPEPDLRSPGKDTGKSPLPLLEGSRLSPGYSVVGALLLVECGLIATGVMTGSAYCLLIAAFSSVAWGVVSMICAAHFLSQRGIRIIYPLIGLLIIIEYLPRYRTITLQESGRVGPLYYSYILAMNFALCSAVLFLVLHRW